MKIFDYKIIFIFFENKKKIRIFNKKYIFVLVAFPIYLISCSSTVSLQIVRPPIHKIEKIDFIEIGNFEFVEGGIFLPSLSESKYSQGFLKENNLLNPPITNFFSKKKNTSEILDLLESAIIHEISINSPYKIFIKKDNKIGFTGTVPDSEKIGILNAKIKFSEEKIESKEDLSYFTNIKNKGVSLEQSILARTISMGAEASGVGFKVSTPYVEQIAAVEVEFSLLKKNDRTDIIPKKTIKYFFTKKWGGDPKSSHLPKKIKAIIQEKYQNENENNETFLSRIDKAGLSFTDESEYFARGFNLKSSPLVPKTSLELKINLVRQVAKKYLRLFIPYSESSNLVLKDGNEIAKTLISADAFQEAISYIQGIDNRKAEDEYNLGLSYEALGEYKQANFYYNKALVKDPDDDSYIKAVKRTKNY